MNPLCEYDSRREPFFFSTCLQELNPFLKHFTPRIELCKEKTQRIELFFFEEVWLKDLIFFVKKLTQRFLNFFSYD